MGCEISVDLCFGTLLKGTRLGHGHELRHDIDMNTDMDPDTDTDMDMNMYMDTDIDSRHGH